MMSQKKHFWDIITYGAERGFYSIFKLTTVQCVVLNTKENGFSVWETALGVAGKHHETYGESHKDTGNHL